METGTVGGRDPGHSWRAIDRTSLHELTRAASTAARVSEPAKP